MDEREISKPTLAMVAQYTGVSLSTVSKVLNDRPDVAADTRDRVKAAIRELNYIPSTDRSGTARRSVEVVLGNGFNPYSVAVLEGVTNAAVDEDVDVVIQSLHPFEAPARSRRGAQWPREVLARRRSGVVIITPDLSGKEVEAFRRLQVPLVLIDPVNISRDDVTSIGSTNWAGGLSATQYLLDQGHRRIAFAGGIERSLCSQARLHGYRAALENAGVSFDRSLVAHGRFAYEDGLEMGGRLLELAEPPTAIFAASDPTALGIMEAARLRRMRLPEDLSVVGFDDSWYATGATPQLTTVHQPLRAMGRAALRSLLTLSEDGTLDSRHVELATRLVVRDSVAPPRTP